MSERLVTRAEAARMTGVCVDTISKWVRRGRIRAVPASRGAPRIILSTLWRSRYHKTLSDDLPWRVTADGQVVAMFAQERDARGFAHARYKGAAHVHAQEGDV